MSMPEDNPFKRSPQDPVYVDGPPQSSSKKGCLIGCGIVGLLGLLVCCGGVAFFGIKGPGMLASVVDAAVAEELRSQLPSDPNVQQHIGEIKTLNFDFTKTIENAQKASEAGEETSMAFRIEGSNGSGVVLIVQDPSGPNGAGIKSGKLIMDDGSEYPLDMEAIRAAPPGTLEIELDEMFDDGQAEPAVPGDGNQIPADLEIAPIDLSGGVQNADGVDNEDRQ